MALKIGATEFLTTEELAKKLNRHPITILRYIRSGKLKGKKVGRGYFISNESISELFGVEAKTNA